MKSGFIGIAGRPNVGKSTLMNAMLGEKIAITSAKPQTTLNRIKGIYTDLEHGDGEGLQMIFLDTPGIHKPHNKLGSAINETAINTLSGVDVILLIVDGTMEFGKGDESIIRILRDAEAPKILAINKMDLMSPEQYLALTTDMRRRDSLTIYTEYRLSGETMSKNSGNVLPATWKTARCIIPRISRQTIPSGSSAARSSGKSS